jgi:TRAP-type C4-dicarboxylate transport system substrate-binding protein
LYGPQFGGDPEILQNVRLGTLQGGYVTSAGSSGLVPQSSVLELPFIFRGSDHALAVANGPAKQALAKYYDAAGLHLTAIWNYGPREPVGTFAVKSIKDFAGKKIRVKESQLAVDMWKLLGANPTPMAWGEVQNAMLTKTIDGYDTTGSAYWDLKLYEAAPNYTYLPLTYVFYEIVFSKDWWNRLPQEYRTVIEQTADELGPVTHHLMELEDVRGPERAAASGGAKISRVTDLAPYQALMKPLWASWATKIDGGQALIDTIVRTPDKR